MQSSHRSAVPFSYIRGLDNCRRALVFAPFLIKVAKHLALLACVLIAATGSGGSTFRQLGILLLVVLAALLHAAGRAYRRRSAIPIPAPREAP